MFQRSSTTHLVRSSSIATEESEEHGKDEKPALQHIHTAPASLGPKPQPAVEAFPRGVLYVKMFCARQIRGDEYHGIGKADPYVKISYGIRGHQASLYSETHEDAGSEPMWNHKFAFPVLAAEQNQQLLELQIYNRNGITRKDNKLGYLSLGNLAEYVTSKLHWITDEKWFPVFDKKHKQRGEILMSFYFQSLGDHKFADGWDIPNRLNIGGVSSLDQEPAKLRLHEMKKGGAVTHAPHAGEFQIMLIDIES